jgi:hypothetical protein
LEDPSSEHVSEPWSLLSKAENRHRLGLNDEAVIVADEAIEAQLRNAFESLGVVKPATRENAIRVLRKEGVRLSAERMLRLKEIREKAGQVGGDGLSESEADEAISIAEDSISKISEQQKSAKEEAKHEHPHSLRVRASSRGDDKRPRTHPEEDQAPTLPSFESLHLLEQSHSHRKEVGTLETEFVTKLLLARAILNYRKKRIPRIIGLAFAVPLMGASFLLAVIGCAGIILGFFGQSLISVFGLVFDFVYLLIAYLLLKMALYVRRETR